MALTKRSGQAPRTSAPSAKVTRTMPPRGRARILRFEMASVRAAVPRAVERILDHVAPVGLSESQTSNLAIALSEALANAAIHGNQLDPERIVAVTVRSASGEASIDIRDAGPGFDHSGVR